MKNNSNKFIGLFLGIAMTLCVGAAISTSIHNEAIKVNAADVVVSVADFTLKSASHSAYTDSWTYGDWTVTYGSNNNAGWTYVKLGGKNKTISTYNPCSISTTSAIDEEISKAVVSVPTGSLVKTGMSVNSWGLYVYSDSAMTAQIDYVAGGDITNAAASFTFSPTTGTTWAASSYFKVSFDLANTSETNGIVCVESVSLYKTSSATVSSVSLSGDVTVDGGIKGVASAQVTPVVTMSDATETNNATLSVTDSDTYSEESTSSFATVTNAGVVTFSANTTVYVWATSVDVDSEGNKVHTTSGFAITASNLLDGDLLDKSTLGLASSYADFTATINGVDYAGKANGSTSVQMNSGCALYTTSTGGLLKYLSIVVKQGTASIGIYYSNTPFTSATFEGSASKVITATSSFAVEGDYQYFGIKPENANTIYMSEIRVAWQEVAPTSITATPNPVTVSVGGSQDISLEFVNSSGYVVSNKKVTWGSNNASIATVTDGTITGVAGGETTVTAVSKADASVYVEIPVTVSAEAIKVTGITLDKSEVTIYAGQTASVTPTVAPSNATDKTVSWSSDDETAATVSDGTITGVAEGAATITCTANDGSGVTASVDVYVLAFDYAKASSLNGGDKVIIVGADDEHKSFLSGFTTSGTTYGIQTTYETNPFDAVSASVYSVVAGSTSGSVAFKNADGNYIAWTSGNSATTKSTIDANSSWTISFDGTTATMTNVADSTRMMRHNYGSSRFACYTSTTGAAISFFKLGSTTTDVTNATTFATDFNGYLLGESSYCDPDGQTTVTSDVQEAWTLMSSEYTSLADGAKAYIASKDGNAEGDDVEKMLAQYNYIYTKYGESLSLENFLQRKEATKSFAVNSFNPLTNENNGVNAIPVIVIVSLVAVTAIAGVIIIRKQKEN